MKCGGPIVGKKSYLLLLIVIQTAHSFLGVRKHLFLVKNVRLELNLKLEVTEL